MSGNIQSVARPLREYQARRDFSETPEPAGQREEGASEAGARFVVQEHHATRLHWDLRLEHDGALASWAIPNGIPESPKENRKAVHTEDHPVEYLEFEGEIPQGSYGAGTMRIWDRGTYEVEKWEPRKIIVIFHGERLRGRYALFAAGRDEKDWMIHRMDPPEDPGREPMPEHLVPMLAKLSQLPGDQERWGFEVKWDGVRALAYSEPGRLRLESRNLNDITAQYPELRPLNRALSSHTAILDGEIVAFDERGRPSFERLQGRMHLTGESAIRRRAQQIPVTYVLFDLLYLDGHSIMEEPYTERRARLEELALDDGSWRTPAYHPGQGSALLEATAAQGLEGVVAKRLDSRYEPGRRGGTWLKVKNHASQELVIGGWLPGEGRRAERIGALLVGYWEDGELRYAGKVGTGFDDAELRRLAKLLAPLERETPPFGKGRLPKGAHWVEPEIVCEVEFSEWTAQGMLRHPSYKGTREDKDPREVVRERPGAVSEAPEPADPEGASTATALGVGLEQLLAMGRRTGRGAEVELEGRTLKLSNLDKVLYPAVGFTKGDVIDYYARIAPVVLPHLHDRPLTLKRYPEGVEAGHFYEKQCPSHRPPWVQTAAVPSERRQVIDFCLANDAPTLVWLANLADLELHTSLALATAVERPTMVVFDLDPGAPADIVQCCEVGMLLHGMFEGLGLQSFAKTSGSKGLQVYVPLNREGVTYEETKPFAKAVAETLERAEPKLAVSRMSKQLRAGKVLVDWSQNDEHKTTVNVYSLRARERPTVSTPVMWEEVERMAAEGDASLLEFDSGQVLARVDDLGDLFAPVLSLVQSLPG